MINTCSEFTRVVLFSRSWLKMKMLELVYTLFKGSETLFDFSFCYSVSNTFISLQADLKPEQIINIKE